MLSPNKTAGLADSASARALRQADLNGFALACRHGRAGVERRTAVHKTATVLWESVRSTLNWSWDSCNVDTKLDRRPLLVLTTSVAFAARAGLSRSSRWPRSPAPRSTSSSPRPSSSTITASTRPPTRARSSTSTNGAAPSRSSASSSTCSPAFTEGTVHKIVDGTKKEVKDELQMYITEARFMLSRPAASRRPEDLRHAAVHPEHRPVDQARRDQAVRRFDAEGREGPPTTRIPTARGARAPA